MMATVRGSRFMVYGARCVAAACLSLGGLIAVEARPGSVQLSDGTELSGRIQPAAGAQFKFHDGKTLHVLEFAQLCELRLIPEKEEMLRHNRMPEPGRAIIEELGAPYPMRQLKAEVLLADGAVLKGHLYATGISIETRAPDMDPSGDPGERRKLLLPAKQQGDEGSRLIDLVYPARIAFTDAALAAPVRTQIRLADGLADEFAAISQESLVVLTVTSATPPPSATFAIVTPLEDRCFVALRRGNALTVGWPVADPVLMTRMTAALAEAKDFFDGRRLLGVWQPEGSDRIDTLVLLHRRAAITNGEAKPWHLEILRWKAGDGDRLMLAARGTLLRGIAPSEADLPSVTISNRLWLARPVAGILELGL